ncbi:MAG: rhodanese-like domain-containing protein [Deltaproteobacteria bacterium]|nr:rhodanese-like domain-containing protein [Deltaproteobacteria bacterium]
MNTIGTEALRERLEAGPVALFDVRGDVTYEQAHIPGAKTAPLGSLVFRVASVMDRDSLVVVYSGGRDGLAAQATERLEDLRLRNVHCYEEGLEGWQAAGLPVEASVKDRVHTHGPVKEVRPLVVDREQAYGGAFRGKPLHTEAAGG